MRWSLNRRDDASRRPFVRWPLLAGFVLFVAIAAAQSPANDGAPDLRLVGMIDGRDFTQFTAKDGEIFLDSAAEPQSWPRGVRWRLDGELRSAAEQCFFGASYRIVSRPAYPFTTETRSRAFVSIFIGRDWPWSERDLRDAILVIAWMVDGRVTMVNATAPERRLGPSSDIAAIVGFELDAITIAGTPVILLLKGDHFIAPKPWYADAEARTVVADLHLGTPAQVVTSVAALPRGDVRSAREHRPLLHVAAAAGRADAVRALLARGANANALDQARGTALHDAATFGRVEAAQVLLDAGARRATPDDYRLTAFDRAIINGHFAVAPRVLPPQSLLDGLRDPLDRALRHAEPPIVELLLERGASRLVRSVEPESLANLAMAGDESLLRRLIALKMQVDAPPVVLASAFGRRPPVVDAVLAAGAKPDRLASDGTSALMIAAWNGDLPIVEALLKAGAEINRVNVRGESAVFLARVAGHEAVVKALVVRGADEPADPAREEERRRRPAPFESYLPHPGLPVWSATEVDRPPVVKETAPPEVLRSAAVEIRRVREERALDMVTGKETHGTVRTLEYGNLTVSSASDHWALVTMIVEPWGVPSFIQVVDASSSEFARAIRGAVARYRFEPGERQGQRVRTRMLLPITVEI